MALQVVRRLDRAKLRWRRETHEALRFMAAVEANASRAQDVCQDISTLNIAVLETLADTACLRRGPSCRLCGRIMDRAQGSASHRVHRRLRDRLPSRQVGKLQGPGMSHVTHCTA